MSRAGYIGGRLAVLVAQLALLQVALRQAPRLDVEHAFWLGAVTMFLCWMLDMGWQFFREARHDRGPVTPDTTTPTPNSETATGPTTTP